MTKSVPLPGGDLEYSVLAALWEQGEATAKEIHERVGVPARLVYTTVAKVLDRLCAKGLIARERQGKAFTYSAKISPAVVESARARDMLGRLFGSRPQPAVATLVDAVESINPSLLDELARAVQARRRSRRGS